MTRNKGKTNKVTVVKLTSSIEQVVWSRPNAAPGGVVGLEIFTHLVGNGSTLQIELSDADGKKHGVYKEEISGNRFWTSISVPPKAANALIATVKLVKHGLEKTSPALLLIPPVRIENLKWSQDEARRGDVLNLTADITGPPDGTEAQVSIWEHDADRAHDLIAKFTSIVQNGRIDADWEFEYVDDTDDIPTDSDSEKGYQHPEYFFRVEIGGVEAESGILKFQDWVLLSCTSEDGAELDGREYTLILPDGNQKDGKLDKAGVIELADVPPGPYTVVVKPKG